MRNMNNIYWTSVLIRRSYERQALPRDTLVKQVAEKPTRSSSTWLRTNGEDFWNLWWFSVHA